MNEQDDYRASFLRKHLWNIFSISIGIIGILLAIYFGFKSSKSKLPYYAIQSENLINDFISNINLLDIMYEGKKIKNLTVSKFAFWNAGRETINENDIAKADPITIQVKEGCEILGEPIILYPQKTLNQFTIRLSDSKKYINIFFDFIDKHEGVIIKFFHTGNNNDDIIIKGTIKGFGKIINYPVPKIYKLKPYFILILVFSLFIIIFSYWQIRSEYYKGLPFYINIFNIIVYLATFLYILYLYYSYAATPSFFNFFEKELIK